MAEWRDEGVGWMSVEVWSEEWGYKHVSHPFLVMITYIFTSSEFRDGGCFCDGLVNALHHHPVPSRDSTDLNRVSCL